MADTKSVVDPELQNEKARLEIEKLKAEIREAAASAQKEETLAAKERVELLKVQARYGKELAVNTENRVYDFISGVSSASVEQAIAYLSMWARQSKDPITLRFSSPGGSVIDGFTLFDHIQRIRTWGVEVTTEAYGMAASMAAVLLQAGTKRVVAPNAYVLIHEIAFGAVGKIGEVQDEVEFAKALNQRCFRILAARSQASSAPQKLTYEEIAERAKRKDLWLSSEEVVRHGFADEIATDLVGI